MSQISVRAVIALSILAVACDRPSGMKGQRNTTVEFYGMVVDQDGNPLPGATIDYQVEAYPKDWTFETRNRPYDLSKVSAVSDAQGRFVFSATGCMLRLLDARCPRYRHFMELDTSTNSPSTYAYRLIAWSDLWFKSDPDHPAVYIFVKDGLREVSVLPCKGGYESGGGTKWMLNKPAWPKKPSLKDVVYISRTTAPSTQP
jgi:hypothetical protein